MKIIRAVLILPVLILLSGCQTKKQALAVCRMAGDRVYSHAAADERMGLSTEYAETCMTAKGYKFIWGNIGCSAGADRNLAQIEESCYEADDIAAANPKS
jgi:hypothetical protein